MRLNKNKKAGFLMGEFTIQIIVAVIVVVLLIVLVVSVYGIFTDDNELEKAKKQLEKIVELFDKVPDGKFLKTEIFSVDNWFLKIFKNFNYPTGQCLSSSDVVDCLCICEHSDCEAGGVVCEEVDFKVIFDDYPLLDSINLRESVYEVTVSKKGGSINIRLR